MQAIGSVLPLRNVLADEADGCGHVGTKKGGAEDDLRNTGPGGLDDWDCNGEVLGVEAR